MQKMHLERFSACKALRCKVLLKFNGYKCSKVMLAGFCWLIRPETLKNIIKSYKITNNEAKNIFLQASVILD